MKSSLKNSQGFTLIELIMVIVVLGFLAVIAIPEYVDLAPRAKKAGEQGVVGGVRAGIATQIAKRAIGGSTGVNVYPPTLDDSTLTPVADCSTIAAAPFCFDAVIPGGIRDSGWAKTGAAAYTGPNGGAYTYTSSIGTFA
ncbi:MAG: prepilin-type N-terminal cleavage/methylation domain-containing protein [Candidatus Omnitrophica bacterium]|nr:prepilin-type N-terminal cleavage/methylation domain-containing protein [Candidatus Omnitrophota bacterium]